MADSGLWTIDELCGRVESALLAADPSQPSGRVREVPDRRTIRWYTTIGLLDRPAEMRGRKALYRRRHLLQLVAVKRLQARGVPLAEIQARLAGATDHMLADVADLAGAADPADLADPVGVEAGGPTAGAMTVTGGPMRARAMRAEARPTRFWAATAAGLRAPAAPEEDADPPSRPELLPAVRLGRGVTLTLAAATRPLDDDDLSAVQRAAGPLLELLRQRGLDAPQP